MAATDVSTPSVPSFANSRGRCVTLDRVQLQRDRTAVDADDLAEGTSATAWTWRGDPVPATIIAVWREPDGFIAEVLLRLEADVGAKRKIDRYAAGAPLRVWFDVYRLAWRAYGLMWWGDRFCIGARSDERRRRLR